jgi:hypothetical protein
MTQRLTDQNTRVVFLLTDSATVALPCPVLSFDACSTAFSDSEIYKSNPDWNSLSLVSI